MAKTYKPTEAMKENQGKGRALKRKKTTRSYESPYTMTAKSFNEDLSLEDVKSVYRFLTKQKEKINKYNVDVDGFATEDYLDWLDGGANAALAWSTLILKEEGILKSVQDVPEEQTNEIEKSNWTNVQVCKAVNDELMQATYIVLEPDVVDLHGDTYDAETVRKACHSFNRAKARANLFHMVDCDFFDIAESYITPVDVVIGEQIVKAGTWVAVLQFFDEDLWLGVKEGRFSGVSIGATARVEYLEEEE